MTTPNPYSGAATPTGYMIPNSIRLSEEEQQTFSRSLRRSASIGSFSDPARGSRRRSSFDKERDHKKIAATLAKLSKGYLQNDSESVTVSIAQHAEYTLARTPFNVDDASLYRATAHAVRDRLIEQWNDTQQYWTEQDPKRVYYLSLEFLIGRCLQNHLINLDLQSSFAEAIKAYGMHLETIADCERDPALGNGGLGRLAACFLDSMATLNYPAWGYGIRYQYGMFEQRILEDGSQGEFPDFWLTHGNPWEIERLDVTYPVRFYGNVVVDDNTGRKKWVGGEVVQAVAYDMPIPGYDTFNVGNLRLWASKPSHEFDLGAFNQGNYMEAIASRQRAEQISSVLYPNDNSLQGKELRLKQQYFFVCATLRDIIRRFRKVPRVWSELPDKVAVQLNDTHPAIGIAELMRVLVDEEGLPWDEAWHITNKVYSYTNHTVLPEALEKWSVGLISHLLPRHMEIIFEINHHHLQAIQTQYPGDLGKLQRMSLIEEGDDKKVRMANLAVQGSHAVNGVAAIHSELIKTGIFKDFYEVTPEKFQNKTNGVTPRRWVLSCNPTLATLITKWIETSDWVTNMDDLKSLRDFANNPEVQAEWALSKKHNKERLAAYIRGSLGIDVDTRALFDIQVKRIHEYKRQLLNILYVVHRYLNLKAMNPQQRLASVPRVTIFGGKAAPGYYRAKQIIKLINQVSHVINSDPVTSSLFKVVFIPNYNVTNAEIIIPASELSQHISTAGMEASGTSNMKFAMNGCLIIGTWDGANVEIAEEIGEENMFMFGIKADKVDEVRHQVQSRNFPLPESLREVLHCIRNWTFGNPEPYMSILDMFENGTDHFILTADWDEYLEAQTRVDAKYADKVSWLRSSILSTAGSGFFSSDNTIHKYAEEIWHIKPCARPIADAAASTFGVSLEDDNEGDAIPHIKHSHRSKAEAPAVTPGYSLEPKEEEKPLETISKAEDKNASKKDKQKK